MSLGRPRKQLRAFEEKVCQKPFVDHEGNQSISVFLGRRMLDEEPEPSNQKVDFLPPLFSIQVYVTYGPAAEHFTSIATSFITHILVDRDINHSYPIRFDMYFLPGRDVDAIIEHYHAENRAEASYDDYSVQNAFAIVLPKETWESEGVDMVRFDTPEEYLKLSAEEREPIMGKDVSDEGVSVAEGIPLHAPDSGLFSQCRSLSTRLLTIAQNSPGSASKEEEYTDAVHEGITEW